MLLQVNPLIPDSIQNIPSPREEIRQLSSMSLDDIISRVTESMLSFAASLLIAIIVFYIGKFIIKKIYNITLAILIKRDADRSLSTFILSLIRIVLYFILIVTVIGILGIETSSFLALFASAGVAVGMALSGTLQNFAGGVLILLLKPYKIGDYIEAQGYSGIVTEIQIFSTIICTLDNKSIIIPNGGLSTGTINNWSREEYRRVDWDLSLSYGDDFAKARQVILNILADDERIVKQYIEDDRQERLEQEQLDNPAPPLVQNKHGFIWRLFHRARIRREEALQNETIRLKHQILVPKVDRAPVVFLSKLADSSIELSIRAWVRSDDYWPVYFDINERLYTSLPTEGFTFPFPQVDVHLNRN